MDRLDFQRGGLIIRCLACCPTLRHGRRNIPGNAPEWIDFWADAESGVGLRAEVKWADGRQMRFELLESVQLSDQWYHHSEHTPGTGVKRLPAKGHP